MIMKYLLKVKIWTTLMIAPILIAVGAYNFATGNLQHSRAWFIWGLISMLAGICWLVASKRQNKSNSNRAPY
jgi:hypothetical protein